MWPTWMNMLSWWQWAILLAVPPAIISLYFLKLRRHPLVVPSTFLWSRTVEDLHVNSIWQRLRRNILLLLQLLLILLIMLALLRPAWQGRKLIGHRFVFLIDNSASMSATDVKPSRLEQAKNRAKALVDNMVSGDVGMVVSFADTARIEQMLTGDRAALRHAIEAVEPTDRPTSLIEALKVASAQTKHGKPIQTTEDTAAEEGATSTEMLSATAYILSDGRFEQVSEASLGNLRPIYLPVGEETPPNVAILAFQIRRHEKDESRVSAFAQLKNFGAQRVDANITLLLDGKLNNADNVSIGSGETQSIAFDVGQVDSGVLELTAGVHDSLSADDRAWVAINPPRVSEVLLVTPGEYALELALDTQSTEKLAHIKVEPPSFLKTNQYRAASANGDYDLVIFDRCRPETMPQANTLFIGNAPLGDRWSLGERVDVPQIIDIDLAHPMMRWLALDNVSLLEANPVHAGPGGDVLIDSDAGPLLVIAPRGAFQDAVLGFVLGSNEDGQPVTDWSIRQSFPMFVFNTLGYLGNAAQREGTPAIRPGQSIVFNATNEPESIRVVGPDGKKSRPTVVCPGQYQFSSTGQLGIYEVRSGDTLVSRFAVNLFDPNESDLVPRSGFNAGSEKVEGQTGWEAARREIWRPLLWLGLIVLVIEWIVYNRRVSV